MQLNDRKALVTGGTGGIGLALTRFLASAGAEVIAVGRDMRRLTAATADHECGRITAVEADLSSPAEVDRLVERIAAEHPDLSILVNNAAVQTEMDFFAGEREELTRTARTEIATNLDAPVALTIGLLPLLARQPAASVVNISSALALSPKRAAPVYCATKAALHSFTRGLRLQCRDAAPDLKIIEVVMPLVDTNMTRGRGSGKISAEAAARAIAQSVAAGRDEAWIGKARLLPVLNRISPRLVETILR